MTTKQVITAETVRQVQLAGLHSIALLSGAIVTQQAHDDARRAGITFHTHTSVLPTERSMPQDSQIQESQSQGTQAQDPSVCVSPIPVSPVQVSQPHMTVAHVTQASIPQRPRVPVYSQPPRMGATYQALVRQMQGEMSTLSPVESASESYHTPAVFAHRLRESQAYLPQTHVSAVQTEPQVQMSLTPLSPIQETPASVVPQAQTPQTPFFSGEPSLMQAAQTVLSELSFQGNTLPVSSTDPHATTANSDVIERLCTLGEAFLSLAKGLQTSSCSSTVHDSFYSSVHPQQQVFAMHDTQASSAHGASGSTLTVNSDDLFGEIRRQVLQALPQSGQLEPQFVDTLIRKAMSEKGPGCGGGCRHCAKAEQPTVASEDGWLCRVGGVSRVNSAALTFGQPGAENVGMIQVLGGNDAPANVGYIQIENGAYPWVFEQSEVLVVLEGELSIEVNNQSVIARAGDTCTFVAGTQVMFGARGRTKYTTIALNAANK